MAATVTGCRGDSRVGAALAGVVGGVGGWESKKPSLAVLALRIVDFRAILLPTTFVCNALCLVAVVRGGTCGVIGAPRGDLLEEVRDMTCA